MHVEITPDIIQQFKACKEVSGIGATALLKGKKDRPDGLSGGMVNKWINGETKTAKEHYVDYILKIWPNADIVVKITEERSKQLQHKRQTIGVGGIVLFKSIINPPKGLNKGIVDSIIYGKIKSTKKKYLEAIELTYAEIERDPSKISTKPIKTRSYNDRCYDGRYVVLTEELIRELKSYKEQSAIGVKSFLKNCKDIPEGLSISIIESWLSGVRKSARKDYFEYVSEKWKDLSISPYRYIKITDRKWEDLNYEKERTNVGALNLFKNIDNIPEGLTYKMVAGWLSKTTGTARKDYFEYVLQKWRLLPSIKKRF